MNILGDVFKELFKMFVADFRLTVAVLGGVIGVAVLLGRAGLNPKAAGALLVVAILAILSEAVLRSARGTGTRRAANENG